MNDGRKEIVQVIIVLVALVFLIKLFSIQVLDNKYAELADSNAILKQIDYPVRGLLYDRNGKLLVYNTPEYDIQVVTSEIKQLDTAAFCSVFRVTREELKLKFEELRAKKEYSPVKLTTFLTQLSNDDFARIQDRLIDFPGFYIQARSTRSYTTSAFANGLGYVSEISKSQLDRDTTNTYRQGDYIGQSGLEAYYEKYLSGKRGVRFKMRDVDGIDKGSFKNGELDTLSVPGKNLITTIDLDLQLYGEYLMQGKAGSIVAIEPETGEILAFVSGPSYDPNNR
jgi:penicillin-binding protein 2